MKVCILGGSLTSLTVAKALINKGIYVDIFFDQRKQIQDKSRTLGISKSSIEFFNKEILNIEKLLWNINKIEINSENLDNKQILNFENNNQMLFSITENFKLYNYLLLNIKKSTYLKFKVKKESLNHIRKKYQLIINCEKNNELTKKYFHKKLSKNYDCYAYTAIMEHKKLSNNHVALQVFTKNGPLAFLPISNMKTSLVYSFQGKNDFDFKKEVKKYNQRYQIIKISEPKKTILNSSDLRNYYHDNILAFGNLAHKIHPLAGQGFNMSIRDLKELLRIVQFKLDHGLELDRSICQEFEKKRKHKNFIFASGIDIIYELFKFESKTKNDTLSRLIKSLGNHKFINKTFSKFADVGIIN